ncbi:hypothetical protein ACQ27_gp283 [Klebsiella phage K64-1]|nr:hypothetical protein ACQ27_gp283 [Klebsiella phage K64-1]
MIISLVIKRKSYPNNRVAYNFINNG